MRDPPANGAAWLANKRAPFNIGVEPGRVVLGRSFTRVLEARPTSVPDIDLTSMRRSRHAVRSVRRDRSERDSRAWQTKRHEPAE